MSDGHTGIEYKEFKREGLEDFDVALTFLKPSDERKEFVAHVRPKKFFSSGIQLGDILEKLNFEKFTGCPIFQECYYKVLREQRTEEDTKTAHQQFDGLVKELPTICSNIREAESKARECGLSFFK